MEFNLFALLGISLAAMFFGYFFGLFEGRGQGYKKRKKEEESDKNARPAVQTPLPPQSAPVVPAERGTNLLKLSLDEKEQPRLELDGQHADTSQLAPEQRKRLIDLMLVMRPWVEAGRTQKTSEGMAQAVSAQPAVQPMPAAGTTPVSQPRLTPVPVVPVQPTALETAPTANVVGAPTTMVGQIDAILQTNLAGTPLAGQGIRLVESPEGGAMVVVGMKRYAGVGEVPDPEVQAVIRAAIAEWEKRYTPG